MAKKKPAWLDRLGSDVAASGITGKQDFSLPSLSARQLETFKKRVPVTVVTTEGGPGREGRRRGAVNALGRLILDILQHDRRKAAKDVLQALRDKLGGKRVYKHPAKGWIVTWTDPNGKE